ncbi:hypothetical protein TNCV_643511 [Trichonephila clavipes]|nr:hypothetical protein TNCV_643511 [Trichonephila clavipes]
MAGHMWNLPRTHGTPDTSMTTKIPYPYDLNEMGSLGSLVVRASDSRPEGLGSMLDVTKYPPSAHEFTCRNCGGGDICRVAIYRPFGEFHRA